MGQTAWQPPLTVSREQILEDSEEVLAKPEIAFDETEDVFRISEAGMDWDIGVRVYEPRDPARIPSGPDGRKIGVFLLHGGEDDWRQLDPMARTLSGKFGYKVLSGTFPGRLYLQDPSREWPGDTINPDGSVRTPIWVKDELIERDEYDVVEDRSYSLSCIDSSNSRPPTRRLRRTGRRAGNAGPGWNTPVSSPATVSCTPPQAVRSPRCESDTFFTANHP